MEQFCLVLHLSPPFQDCKVHQLKHNLWKITACSKFFRQENDRVLNGWDKTDATSKKGAFRKIERKGEKKQRYFQFSGTLLAIKKRSPTFQFIRNSLKTFGTFTTVPDFHKRHPVHSLRIRSQNANVPTWTRPSRETTYNRTLRLFNLHSPKSKTAITSNPGKEQQRSHNQIILPNIWMRANNLRPNGNDARPKTAHYTVLNTGTWKRSPGNAPRKTGK